MNGYIDTIQPHFIKFSYGNGKTATVTRATFGNHLILAKLRTELSHLMRRNMTKEAEVMLRRYFFIAGVGDDVISELNGKESILLYLALVTFNSFQIKLPFLKPNERDGNGTQKPLPYDYEDRQWAAWVTLLADTFGWSRQDIFNMPPEEVACYVQEATVISYYKQEQARSLSELSYKYDKVSKTSKFIATPVPFWMAEGLMIPEKKFRMKKMLLPVGNIVDLKEKIESHSVNDLSNGTQNGNKDS